MKTETYLIAVFIWQYKEQLEKENDFTLDESYNIAQCIVSDYLGEDGYIPQHENETDDFIQYVEKNLSEYI